MSDRNPADLTTLLHAWRDGSGTAFAGVLDQVYAQLKRIAARRLEQSGRMAATLSPTDLLHEALIGFIPAGMDFKNRAHFYATMSLAIRSILIDHARARSADKRGGHAVHLTLDDGLQVGEESLVADLLTMEQALTQLESADPRAGQVMHLTYFGGLAQEEIGELLSISIPTVKRDLRFARAWILKALAGE